MEIFRLLKSVVAVHNSMSNLRVLFVSFSNQSFKPVIAIRVAVRLEFSFSGLY